MFLEKEDWQEPGCCFEPEVTASEIRKDEGAGSAGEARGKAAGVVSEKEAGNARGKRRGPKEQPSIHEVIEKFDALLAKNLKKAAQNYLEDRLARYEKSGDWASQITILNEMMGFYRNNGKKEKGLESVRKGLALIEKHRLSGTVSGGTTYINAATTLKTFGETKLALPYYEQAFRAYGRSLSPEDYRFGGLFNNMAVTYMDLGEYEKAEVYYKKAMEIMEKLRPGSIIEIALTWVNLAVLYEKWEREEEIDGCMERAAACFHSDEAPHDAYYALNCQKCAKTFGHFGYFRMQKELTDEAKRIYGEARAQG